MLRSWRKKEGEIQNNLTILYFLTIIFRLLDASAYLTRLKSTIGSKRLEDKKDYGTPALPQDKVTMGKQFKRHQRREENQNSDNYFQVEISNRHSSGSDKYSVIEERDNINTSENKDTIEKDTDDDLADADGVTDYSFIDVTGLVPRSVN